MGKTYFIECGTDGGRLFSGEKTLAERAMAEMQAGRYEIVTITEIFHNQLSETYERHVLVGGRCEITYGEGKEPYIKDMAYECETEE